MNSPRSSHAAEVARAERFRFGENWRRFLGTLDDERIGRAEESLRDMLGGSDLGGRRFLDIGCGSGLSSLAARRLGATVHSFDYDPASVACAMELRQRFFPDDRQWTVEEGSALDRDYMGSLGSFDIVYSWGVLHHTGQMWEALDAATLPVAPGGQLFIAIYNDCGPESEAWTARKQRYCSLPRPLRVPYALMVMAPYEARDLGRAVLKARPQEYLHSWTRYRGRRGMSRWHDLIDWVGGYPYEYASVPRITDFFAQRGFEAERTVTNKGLGCNEFVFRMRARAGG